MLASSHRQAGTGASGSAGLPFGLFPRATLTVLAADDPYAVSLFQKNCATCHMSSQAAARIPQLDVLKRLTPVAILRTRETGVMKAQAAQLSTNERQAIANYLGKPVTPQRQANACSASLPCAPQVDRWRRGAAEET
jgi:mono/diheme cytochrome c family protein